MDTKPMFRNDYKPLNYNITHCDLRFELDDRETKVYAKSRVKVIKRGENLILNGETLQLKSLKINEKDAEFETFENRLEIKNTPRNDFILEIETQINPLTNTALEGLYKSSGAFCTQCEAEGFRKITYFIDRPDNLCVFTTEIVADKNYKYLLSNGNKIYEEVLGEKRTVKWSDPFPKPSYLFALVAGDFDVLEDRFITRSRKKVVLQIFVDKGNRNLAKHAMQSLKKAMEWDEKRFGFEYDLDIYMIVAVDFFNMGAMENKGLNVFNSKYVLADEKTATDDDFLNVESVIAHEYFHNWTGNRITCRDWFQLSLKEGLTVFRDQEFSMDINSRVVERIKQVRFMRTTQFAEDSSPMSHPIRPEKVIERNNFYSATVYDKGAEVIRMIHTILGEEKFMAGMRLYVKRHDGSAATCDDFVDAMHDASGIDLSQFRLWYSQSGTPIVNVEKKYDKNAKTFTLKFEQKTTPTLVIPCDVAVCNQSAVLLIKEEKESFTFEDINEEPKFYLFRNFSAPIKCFAEYKFFASVEKENQFSVWDMFQEFVKKDLMHNKRDTFTFLKDLFENEKRDISFFSEILTIPSQTEMSEWWEKDIPVEEISQMRKTYYTAVARDFGEKARNIYKNIKPETVAKRKFRNTLLYVLAHDTANETFVFNHYKNSNNMTDTVAALKTAVFCGLNCSRELLFDFEQKWLENPLVMDKWFAVQTLAPFDYTLDVVKKLMTHPKFDFGNPNRLRALIGSFCQQNPYAFHLKDGSGYAFLTEILEKLDPQNPQIAARFVTALTTWKKYDKNRQILMRGKLEKILKFTNLSKNLYEIVNKAVEE